jgi:transcriptional regulator with XRE-family HTH domain
MGAVWISRIGELLAVKSRQERRDVTIEELADFVGVSRQTIHAWKSHSGVKTIPANHTAKLCEFFDVSEWELWELIEEESEQSPEQSNEGQLVAVA